MANDQTWDTGYELVPSNDDALSSAPLMYAGLTEGLRERIAHEHEMTVGSNNQFHGRHLEGSFAAFYQSTCPLVHVDGEDLGDGDIGLVWYDSRTTVLKVWMGSDDETGGWEPISNTFAGYGDSAGLRAMEVLTSITYYESEHWDDHVGAFVAGLGPVAGFVSDGGAVVNTTYAFAVDKAASSALIYYEKDGVIGTISIEDGGSDAHLLFGGFNLGE